MPLEKQPDSIMEVVQCSFAVEYDGPPLPYHLSLPRAVPINVDRIPVATVVSPVCISDNLSLPVVQPIVAGDALNKKFSKERMPSSVSPTSVIGNCESNELELVSESTVSPTSVIAFEERTEEGSNCVLSGELSCSNYGSGELSRQMGSCSISHELLQSSTIEFSDSFEHKSRDSSDMLLRLSDGREESLDLNDSSNPIPDWEYSESILSMDYPSSRVSSMKTKGECKRQSIVTFDSFEIKDSNSKESRAIPIENQRRTKKKGSCYRCLKGNRFKEKEICIVCDAKYCSKCVLRAMGSMPEGRKCVICIGYSIDESKRGCLGKCSKMLKRLLNDLEVKQIMKAEKFCEVNQLPAEYVYVNGQNLNHEELVALQTCSNPPKKLKPGSYWYDKVSGLWGKEGEKPSQIISPHLNIGGSISPNASNGNTQVFINGREITKVELRMLQLAGVQCAGNPHFWVNEDGSYQEEGQKNTKGYIWGKAGTKLLCAIMSLPVPSKSSMNPSGEQMYNMNSRSIPDYLENRILQKILLVGYKGSGTSTIFKQAKILYKDIPFSEDERENIKVTIQTNVYSYLGMLLDGRERFEEEALSEMNANQSALGNAPAEEGDTKNNTRTLYSIGPRHKDFSDWLLKAMVSNNLGAIFPAATREYAPVIEELWRDAAIQATYKRRNELRLLPSVASYFLERAVDILKTDYEPSDLDILYAEGVTLSSGLACVDFSFPQTDDKLDPDDQHDAFFRYQLIRVPSRGLGENCKWIDMFEDVGMVVFVVALSDYDEFTEDGSNKMIVSKKLFESIVTHPIFEHMDFLLILNKFDKLEEKVEQVPLTRCEWFEDFHPVVSRHRSNASNGNPSLGQLAFHYIGVKFKRFYASLTGKKLYVSMNKGLDPNSVDMSLKFAKEILKWGEEERTNICLSDYSMYSTEASSFSH